MKLERRRVEVKIQGISKGRYYRIIVYTLLTVLKRTNIKGPSFTFTILPHKRADRSSTGCGRIVALHWRDNAFLLPFFALEKRESRGRRRSIGIASFLIKSVTAYLKKSTITWELLHLP